MKSEAKTSNEGSWAVINYESIDYSVTFDLELSAAATAIAELSIIIVRQTSEFDWNLELNKRTTYNVSQGLMPVSK